MSECKDITDKLDKIRKEKFIDVFGYETSEFIQKSNIKII